jgi:beta-aspartyl-dipeptidase (metallo-type)
LENDRSQLVHLHDSGLGQSVIRIVKGEIPIGQFPTRGPDTGTPGAGDSICGWAGISTAKKGFPHHQEALQKALDAGIAIDQITLSSDSNGSMPVFDEKGNLIRLAVGDIQNLFREWRDLIREGFPIDSMLKLVTANPAKRIGAFSAKGSLAVEKMPTS